MGTEYTEFLLIGRTQAELTVKEQEENFWTRDYGQR